MDVFLKLIGIAVVVFAVLGGFALIEIAGRKK